MPRTADKDSGFKDSLSDVSELNIDASPETIASGILASGMMEPGQDPRNMTYQIDNFNTLNKSNQSEVPL